MTEPITETFIWAVSHDYVSYMLTCELGFYVTKPDKNHGADCRWYTKEEKRHYQDLIVGSLLIRINYMGKTFGLTDATKIYTEIYKTKYKTVFVQVDGDERGSGVFAISKKGFSVKKFTKSAKYAHKREAYSLENKRELFVEYLPEGV